MERPYSLYDVLNVSPGAPTAAIEAAYRALMKKHHPDQAGPGSGDRAAEINAAFSVLRDPALRASYDRQEQGRQRALISVQVGRLRRRRRLIGWAGWGAAALLVGGATAVAADRYGEALVRPAQSVVVESEALPKERKRFDPGALISEVLSETRRLTLAPAPQAPRSAPAPEPAALHSEAPPPAPHHPRRPAPPAASRSAITPSLSGRSVAMWGGVRPIISFAAVPTATILSVCRLIATTEGSSRTTPFLRTYTSVLAVPRSTAMSRPSNPHGKPIADQLSERRESTRDRCPAAPPLNRTAPPVRTGHARRG